MIFSGLMEARLSLRARMLGAMLLLVAAALLSDVETRVALLGEARAAAVKDAIDKASVYAKAAGVGLGPILAIQEGGSDAPRPMFKAMARFPDQNVPLAAGEESVSASVSITWLIN